MNCNTVIILGSSNSHGDTRKIVEAVREKINADLIDLNDLNIGYFDYEFKNQDDDFFKTIERILEYENIIFASPVYWYSMSAVMKTFFDRISDLLKIRKPLGRRLRGKTMWVISSSSDSEVFPSFLKAFELSAEYLGMLFGGNFWGWLEDGAISEEVKVDLEGFVGRFKIQKNNQKTSLQ